MELKRKDMFEMGHRIVVLLVLSILLAGFISSPLWAQIRVVGEEENSKEQSLALQEVVAGEDLPFYLIKDSDFDTSWFAYKEAMSKGDFAGAVALLEKMLMLKEQRNIQRLTFYANALIADGYLAYLKDKDIKHAQTLFSIANQMDSMLPAVYYLPFAVEISEGFSALGKAGQFFNGLATSFTGIYNTVYSVSKILSCLVPAFVISGLIFAAIIFIKYQRQFRHDIQEAASRKFAEPGQKFISWLLLLLPFALWLGFEFIALYFLAVLLPYSRPSEKFIGFMVIIGFFLYVPWLQIESAVQKSLSDDELKLYLLADESFYTNDVNSKVDKMRRQKPKDHDLEMIQVKVLLHYGRLADAYNAYRILNAKDPNDIDILLNMGNIRYKLGEYELAKIHYENALERRPNDVRAIYNLKLATEQQDPFRDTSQFQREIQRLDPEFYDTLFAHGEERKQLVEPGLAASLKKQKTSEIFRKYLSGEKASLAIETLIVNPLSIASLAAFLLLVGLLIALKERGFAVMCGKCGQVFCKKCTVGSVTEKYCSQCNSIFFVKDGVSGKIQRAKLTEIKRNRSTNTAIKIFLSLLVPGARKIYTGKTFQGFFTLVKSVFLISFLFLSSMMIVNPSSTIQVEFGTFEILAVALLVQTWLVSIIGGITKVRKGD